MKPITRAIAAAAAVSLALTGLTSTPVHATESYDVSPAPLIKSNGNGFLGGSSSDVVVEANGGIAVAAGAIPGKVQRYTPNGATYTTGTSITAANAGLGFIYAIALDPSGRLWTADYYNNVASRFAKGASGDAYPQKTISGSHTELGNSEAIAIGRNGDIFVGSTSFAAVQIFAADGGGNGAPTRSLTGIQAASGIAFDGAGRIYVSSSTQDKVMVFAAGADAGDPPQRTIVGDQTDLSSPSGIAIDSSDNLYVANSDGNSVTVYAAGASGNAAPVKRLMGPDLLAPTGIALDANRNIHLSTAVVGTGALLMYAPLRPFLKPTAARVMKVTGTSKSKTRTITWAFPSNNGGTPITKYRIIVKKGSKTLYDKYTTSRAYKVSRTKLKSGTNTVYVYAYNKVGSSPVLAKSFTVKK